MSFRLLVRAWLRSSSKAASSPTAWRSIRIPFARSVLNGRGPRALVCPKDRPQSRCIKEGEPSQVEEDLSWAGRAEDAVESVFDTANPCDVELAAQRQVGCRPPLHDGNMKVACEWHDRLDSLAPPRAATKGGGGEEDPRARATPPRYAARAMPGLPILRPCRNERKSQTEARGEGFVGRALRLGACGRRAHEVLIDVRSRAGRGTSSTTLRETRPDDRAAGAPPSLLLPMPSGSGTRSSVTSAFA